MNIDIMAAGIVLKFELLLLMQNVQERWMPIVEPIEQKALIFNSDFNQDSLCGLE